MKEILSNYGMTFLWLLVAVGAAFVEGVTCELVAIWFLPGALCAMALSFFVDNLAVLVAVFLAVSVLTMVLARNFIKKKLQKDQSKTNADALIGEKAIVEEDVDNLHEKGSVRVKGLTWSARTAEDSVLVPAGEIVVIQAISGVKLIVTQENKNK